MNSKQKKVLIAAFVFIILIGLFVAGVLLSMFMQSDPQIGIWGIILSSLSTSLMSQSIWFIPKYFVIKIQKKDKEELTNLIKSERKKIEQKEQPIFNKIKK